MPLIIPSSIFGAGTLMGKMRSGILNGKPGGSAPAAPDPYVEFEMYTAQGGPETGNAIGYSDGSTIGALGSIDREPWGNHDPALNMILLGYSPALEASFIRFDGDCETELLASKIYINGPDGARVYPFTATNYDEGLGFTEGVFGPFIFEPGEYYYVTVQGTHEDPNPVDPIVWTPYVNGGYVGEAVSFQTYFRSDATWTSVCTYFLDSEEVFPDFEPFEQPSSIMPDAQYGSYLPVEAGTFTLVVTHSGPGAPAVDQYSYEVAEWSQPAATWPAEDAAPNGALKFDATGPFGGYLQLNDTGDNRYGMEAGDFTIEFAMWACSENSGNPRVFSVGQYPTAKIGMSLEGSAYFWFNGQGYSCGTYLTDAWMHVLIRRTSGVIEVFFDGELRRTFTSSYDMDSEFFMLGAEDSGDASTTFRGVIAGFHLVKGQSLYASDLSDYDMTAQPELVEGFTVLLLTGTTPPFDTSELAGTGSASVDGVAWNPSSPYVFEDVAIDYNRTVTVAAADVPEDMNSFPLAIDLSSMPPTFWEFVNDTGGNIRAYAADGETRLPLDVTYIDTTRQIGRAFMLVDLVADTDNVFNLLTLQDTDAALEAVDGTYGRNAVWGDYEVVWVFPDTANRSGKAHSQDVNGLLARSDWARVRYQDFDGDPHQGIAVSGDTVITIDTNYLRRYHIDDLSTLLASNADPITATGIAGVNHFGDGTIIGDELYVVLELYPNSPYNNQHICVFDADDLTFKRSYDISSYAHEVSGIAYDGTNLWITEFTNDNRIHKYDLIGNRIEIVALSSSITDMQSVVVVDGKLIIASDTSAKRYFEVEFDGTVNGIIHIRANSGINEGMSYDDGKLWLMNGDGNCEIVERITHLADFRKVHYDSVWSTVSPRSTVWSMAASIYWAATTGLLQQSFLGYANGTSNSQRANIMFDEGPNVIGMWNSTDSWAHTDVQPPAYALFRLAGIHDGTVGRKLFFDGVKEIDDAGISARPSGTGTSGQFVINGAETGSEERGEAYYQTVWLRHEAMSDAWMTADYKNMHSNLAVIETDPV